MHSLMLQDVLAIHGAGEPRLRDGQVYWEPLLRSGLGAGYRVEAPRMPAPDDPHYRPWAHEIANRLETLASPVLVGHPFGASVLLKFLAQATAPPSFRGLFLVATPFWEQSLPESALTQDELERLSGLAPVYLYQSRDDEEIGLDHLERYAHAMPQAMIRVLDGRGHEFNQATFPELMADIRELPEK